MGAACWGEGAARAKAQRWEVAYVVTEEEMGQWGWSRGEAGWGLVGHGEGFRFGFSSFGTPLEDRNRFQISSAERRAASQSHWVVQ